MERFRSRLFSLAMQNIGTKIISFIIAIVLWMIVLGSRNVEVTKEIPIEVITSSDVVTANDIPEKVSFRLSGPKAFLRAILDRREDPIRVNLAGAKPGMITYRFFSDNIRLPIGVKVQNVNPAAMLVKLEYIKRKDVPVRVELHGVPQEGYRISKVSIQPSQIRIKGAESRVDAITEIVSSTIEVSSLKHTIERELPVDISRLGVQIEGALPNVTLLVEADNANFRLKNLEIKVLTSGLKYQLEERTVTLLVRATPEAMTHLDRTQLTAVVDLRKQNTGKFNAPIFVTTPEDITLVKVIPDHVRVVLSK